MSILFLVCIFFGLYFDNFNIFKFCILSSILHELGHIAIYVLYEKRLPQINVSPFGFRMKNDIKDDRILLKVLIAGPVTNLVLFLILRIIITVKVTMNIYVFMTVNLIIFIINMLPIYYLDGGQILKLKWAFYYNNEQLISLISMVILSVMLIYFTDNFFLIFSIFLLYFIINIVRDY